MMDGYWVAKTAVRSAGMTVASMAQPWAPMTARSKAACSVEWLVVMMAEWLVVMMAE